MVRKGYLARCRCGGADAVWSSCVIWLGFCEFWGKWRLVDEIRRGCRCRGAMRQIARGGELGGEQRLGGLLAGGAEDSLEEEGERNSEFPAWSELCRRWLVGGRNHAKKND